MKEIRVIEWDGNVTLRIDKNMVVADSSDLSVSKQNTRKPALPNFAAFCCRLKIYLYFLAAGNPGDPNSIVEGNLLSASYRLPPFSG